MRAAREERAAKHEEAGRERGERAAAESSSRELHVAHCGLTWQDCLMIIIAPPITAVPRTAKAGGITIQASAIAEDLHKTGATRTRPGLSRQRRLSKWQPRSVSLFVRAVMALCNGLA